MICIKGQLWGRRVAALQHWRESSDTSLDFDADTALRVAVIDVIGCVIGLCRRCGEADGGEAGSRRVLGEVLASG